jgi:hypothetical protein
LQVMQIGWNDDIKGTLNNIRNKLEKFMEEEMKLQIQIPPK